MATGWHSNNISPYSFASLLFNSFALIRFTYLLYIEYTLYYIIYPVDFLVLNTFFLTSCKHFSLKS